MEGRRKGGRENKKGEIKEREGERDRKVGVREGFE